MMNLDQIIYRFKKINNIKTDKDAAKKLNLSPTDFSNRKKRETLLPLIIESLVHEKVDMNWLLTGEGEMSSKQEECKNEIFAPDSKVRNYLFPENERTETNLGDMEKHIDLIRMAAKIDRRVTLNAMISLREYLDKQIEMLSE